LNTQNITDNSNIDAHRRGEKGRERKLFEKLVNRTAIKFKTVDPPLKFLQSSGPSQK
jgi:hypothetical protein